MTGLLWRLEEEKVDLTTSEIRVCWLPELARFIYCVKLPDYLLASEIDGNFFFYCIAIY